MTDLEYEILAFVSAGGEVHWVSVLNEMHPVHSYKDTDVTLKHLVSVGLLEICSADRPPYCSVRLSDDGGFAMIEENSLRADHISKEQNQKDEALQQAIREKADKKADRDAEHRFQAGLSFWNTVLGAILGAVLCNLDRIVPEVIDLIKEFF